MVTPESQAIPYEAKDLHGERLLVLAPHPDDEVIGCGGVVARHLRDGRRVQVVVATDGAEAGAGDREAESREGLAVLGERGAEAELTFLRFADRHLAENVEALRDRLVAIIRESRPDLILVPSPIEIHPDHVALSTAFCAAVQGDPALFADAATARVAFYEVSQTIRPNALVDITPFAEAKYAAIAAHHSQTALHEYVSYARGLNAFRSMTLPGAAFAEAYWIIELPKLRTMPFSALRQAIGEPPRVEVVQEPLPVSVVVRTKDRPVLLAEALESIRATRYPCEVVVVNDGGARPAVEGVKLIEHETSRGRSEAANAGVRAATNAFVCFLDDDDRWYPEHLETLAHAARDSQHAARDSQHAAWYSDAVSAFVRRGASGRYETEKTLRLFSRDFDPALLLADNYIPLPTLLIPRASLLDAGGFDPAFDLFEDWDLLIRLSQRGAFVHVPRITCEIRHVADAGSITMANPEGSSQFREAKKRIWAKHAARLSNDVFADALESLKSEMAAATNDAIDARGARHHMETDLARLEREKQTLIADVTALHARIGALTLEAASLHAANDTLGTTLGQALEKVQRERDQLLVRVGELGEHRAAFEEGQRTITVLYSEIARLQNLLDTIYGSRTWKLHTIVERMKGRH
jgi:LmbE family N-acetylglucosaminyl deacetylase/GT2 family glycosyltransferase